MVANMVHYNRVTSDFEAVRHATGLPRSTPPPAPPFARRPVLIVATPPQHFTKRGVGQYTKYRGQAPETPLYVDISRVSVTWPRIA